VNLYTMHEFVQIRSHSYRRDIFFLFAIRSYFHSQMEVKCLYLQARGLIYLVPSQLISAD